MRLYTGITTDLQRRLAEHNEGGKAGSQSAARARSLASGFHQPVRRSQPGLCAEYRVKQLNRAGKERLIAGDITIQSLLSGED